MAKKKARVRSRRTRAGKRKADETRKYRPKRRTSQATRPQKLTPKQRKAAKLRSDRAKRSWATRRANERARTRKRRNTFAPRWRPNPNAKHFVALTNMYANPDALKGARGERVVMRDAGRLMDLARVAYPHAISYGGTIIYKRSTQHHGRWEQGLNFKFLPMIEDFTQARELVISQAHGFFLDLLNPDRSEYQYRVKLVGLAAVVKRYEPKKYPEHLRRRRRA